LEIAKLCKPRKTGHNEFVEVFPMKRYRRFSDHLKQKFGFRVYKISLDAGLSCPNRDGTINKSGCIFCDPFGGSGRNPVGPRIPLTEQVQLGIQALRKKYRAEKFIAYFQTFTNTYGPTATLKKLYDEALSHQDIIGLSIATRPDCIGEEALDLIESYKTGYDVWIELGIQSLREKSLRYIERGHGLLEIEKAIQDIKKRNIQVCAHLILGLPGESIADMIFSVRGVSDLGVDAVKFHMLYITQNSNLARDYREGKIPLLNRDEYVAAVVEVLENLAPDILIQRLVSEAHSDILVAPGWLRNKSLVIQDIEDELEKQDTFQGRLYSRI
jgi:radical SAM protein (TIGR01212 family)